MNITDGDEQIADLPPLSPYADIDEIRLYLQRLDQWRRSREPVAAGSVLTKYVTNGALVARGLLDFNGGTEGGGSDNFSPDGALTASGGLDGANGADAPIVTLTSTGQAFITPANGGTITPASVTLTATAVNMPGATYQWLVNGVVDGAATTNTYTVNSFAPGTSKLIRVNVTSSTAVTVFDSMSIFSLKEGSDALSAGLENENQTIQCSYLGTPVPGSFPVTSVMVVARGATFLAAPDVTFSVVESTGIESAGTTTGASANVSINSAGAITIGKITSNYAEAKFRATVGAVTIDKVLTLNKSINGGDGSAATTLSLSATGFAFIFADANATTATTPAQVDFTAALQNIGGSVTWAATAYNAAGASLGAVTLTLQTATTCRLTAANFVTYAGTRTVRVTATLGALSDSMTVYRGDNGTSTVQVILSNESHTLQANSAGTVSNYSGSGTTIRVAEGTTELTCQSPGTAAGTWYASASASGITAGTLTDSGIFMTVGDHSNMSANQASVTYTVTGTTATGAAFSFTKVQSLAKSVAGSDGTGSAGARGSLILYSSSVSPTLNLSGTTWPLDTVAPFGTNDNQALKIVWQALGNSAASFVTDSVSHMRIGDTVTLVNAGGTVSLQRYWTGTYWADPGTVISGNLLVGGTISGAVDLNITGFGKFEGANSYTVNINGSSTTATTALLANSTGVSQYGAIGQSTTAGAAGLYGYNSSSFGTGVGGYSPNFGVSGFGGVAGVYGQAVGAAAGVRGESGATAGAVGVAATNAGNSSNFALSVAGKSTFSAQITSTLSSGTAPFAVSSTTVNGNFNADLLDGFHAGNSSSQIPISNGSVCSTLNADLLDGQHGSYYNDAANLSGNIAAARMSTNIMSAIGYTPVQQGTGTGQAGNAVKIGWDGSSALRLQIDFTDFVSTWPIGISGNAGGLSSAAWASPGAIGSTTPNTMRCSSLRIDQTPTTGFSTATVATTTKPGSSSTNSWLSVNLNGTTYYIPVWT